MSNWDVLASVYDRWTHSVNADIEFYKEQALEAGSPVVELGIGTGRVAIPIAQRGMRVIGIDSSPAMLEVCRRRAIEAGVAELLDLRIGLIQEPPVPETVPIVICPFRTMLHLHTEADRKKTLLAIRSLLAPGGRFVFDVFTAAGATAAAEERRGQGDLSYRDVWDERRRRLTVDFDWAEGSSRIELDWISRDEWRSALDAAGFEIRACYGWFDRRPCADHIDAIWDVRRPT
jgi:SAM-dependent methyltransferase